MTRNYYSQWEKKDLDSWHGINHLNNEEEVDFDKDFNELDPRDEKIDENPGCKCGYYCFDCLGMSWQDFM